MGTNEQVQENWVQLRLAQDLPSGHRRTTAISGTYINLFILVDILLGNKWARSLKVNAFFVMLP